MTPGALLSLARGRLRLNAARVSPRLSEKIFRRDASISNCDATCCRKGVVVSTAERDAILARAGAVARAMAASPRPGVPRRLLDPAGRPAWFTRRERPDADFQAGRSVDTRVVAGACVFLRADRLCAVHVASERLSGGPVDLKPAYCVLFPLCVDTGAVDVCHASFTRRPRCCAAVQAGARTPLSLLRA